MSRNCKTRNQFCIEVSLATWKSISVWYILLLLSELLKPRLFLSELFGTTAVVDDTKELKTTASKKSYLRLQKYGQATIVLLHTQY